MSSDNQSSKEWGMSFSGAAMKQSFDEMQSPQPEPPSPAHVACSGPCCMPELYAAGIKGGSPAGEVEAMSDAELDQALRSFGYDPDKLESDVLVKLEMKAAEYTSRKEAVPRRLAEMIRALRPSPAGEIASEPKPHVFRPDTKYDCMDCDQPINSIVHLPPEDELDMAAVPEPVSPEGAAEPPVDPSPTPGDYSTWGFYCDSCRKFFDLVSTGEVRTDDVGGSRYFHCCGAEARYIDYKRPSAPEAAAGPEYAELLRLATILEEDSRLSRQSEDWNLRQYRVESRPAVILRLLAKSASPIAPAAQDEVEELRDTIVLIAKHSSEQKIVDLACSALSRADKFRKEREGDRG